MWLSVDLSSWGKRPSDSCFSARTTFWSGMKVTTWSLCRKTVRGAPVRVSTFSICWVPSQTCQIFALDMTPPEDTTKVPTYDRFLEASCMRINHSLMLLGSAVWPGAAVVAAGARAWAAT